MEMISFVVGLKEIRKSKVLRLTGEIHSFFAHTMQQLMSLLSRGCIQSVHFDPTLHFKTPPFDILCIRNSDMVGNI